MDIRSLQRPLKDMYRQDPASSRITLYAHGTQADAPIVRSVDLGVHSTRRKLTKELVGPVLELARETCC